MTREEIIDLVRQMDRAHLELLRQFLDRLGSRQENQTTGKAQDPEDPGSGK